jgi:hypothetical protein
VATDVGAVVLTCVLGCALLNGVASASKAHSAATLAKAKKSLLVLSDMPKGWMSSKSSNNNSTTPDAAQLASCLGVPLTEVNDNPPTVYSPTFNSKDDLEIVDDSVEVFPTAQAARADLASVSSPKAPACLTTNFNTPAARSELEKSFGSGANMGTAVVTRTPASDYGPHTVNITTYVPITVGGKTLNLESAEVGFVRGDEEQMVEFDSIQSSFPAALSRRLMTLADDRL